MDTVPTASRGPLGVGSMQVSEYALFPTRLVAIEFPGVEQLNQDLYDLFATRDEFSGDFDMHPDALNLLKLAETNPALASVRDMFLGGLRRWLKAEHLTGEMTAEMVMFSN